VPIDRNLPLSHAFGPEELALMKQAFDEVWSAHANRILSGHQAVRDEIAAAIIGQASLGEPDVSALVAAGKKVVGKLPA